ncbi:MAG: hypothetical protein IT305_04010 [Chloroflexi bacterium]|nr:hypothetical protein [Chloroflexota bacterium]
MYQTVKAFRSSEGEGAEALQFALAGALAPGPGHAYKAGARFLAGATAESFGKVVGKGTVDLGPTIERIAKGEKGTIFRNREGLLPAKPAGYYREFDVPTEGVKGRGPQRVVAGRAGELYYTGDHYTSFTRINP